MYTHCIQRYRFIRFAGVGEYMSTYKTKITLISIQKRFKLDLLLEVLDPVEQVPQLVRIGVGDQELLLHLAARLPLPHLPPQNRVRRVPGREASGGVIIFG
jgi:hypothetical protein